MTRDVIRLTIADLSQFTKSLRGVLPEPPSHVEMLNAVALAAGYKNFQHLRAVHTPEPPVDGRKLDRALRNFDDKGRFANWPGKTSMQYMCLWAVWALIPPRTIMNEREISLCIDRLTAVKDAAQIRRSLVEMKLLNRTRDGSRYQRVEQPVPAEPRALIAALREAQRVPLPDVAFAFSRSAT
ncbi:DUF2087 domain-containing protein [Parasedimentitalea marina]|uniref:DUF2087 domain-containing protein n=1 Tax=Parasedimentitalea marina TaxID=2483033 RepID=A0A3T0N2C0_9RHOB|nr:DUF2087 domain-containing protein [Parasedimentitalea marina]AZV78139.1 DUF2087 domain-containing protein [Parasedimentitalea marina]